MKVITRLEFELTYFESAFQHFSKDARETPYDRFVKKKKKKKKLFLIENSRKEEKLVRNKKRTMNE